MCKWFIVLLLILTGSLALAQETPAADPELKTHLESLEAVTTQLRGLDTLETVEFAFPSHEELRAFLAGELETSLDDEAVDKAMTFYTAFDFLPPDADLRDIIFNLYEQQIAGFYDPETKKMNVILISGKTLGKSLPLLERVTFVHEYTHALQDQHFDLKSYLDDTGEDLGSDRTLARQALVEGDATYMMTLYTVQTTQDDPGGALRDLLFGGVQLSSLALPPGTPDILGAELLFPYEAGQTFVEALINADNGAWDKVNEAYSQPPESTEQVMHPEKFIIGEAPAAVTLPDDDSVPGAGWTSVQTGTMGEFYLQQYLRTRLKGDMAIPAAAGWGGDTYAIYRNDSTGAQAWRMKIAWDTPADRDEFYTAFEAFMTARTGSLLPDLAATATPQGAATPAPVVVTDSCHIAADVRLCAEYGDDNTVLITSMPAAG